MAYNDSRDTNAPADSNIIIKAHSVQIFIKRVNITFGVLLLLGALLMYCLVYVPLKEALETSLINNFSQISQVNYRSVQNNMQRSMEGARSLSSRTMIKNVIDEYHNKNLSLDELIAYTQPKYEDGAKALEYLLSAERFVDDTPIARYTAPGTIIESNFPAAIQETDTNIVSSIKIAGDHAYAVILSPIVSEQKVIGYDRLVYDLSNSIGMLSTDTVKIALFEDHPIQALLRYAKMIRNDGELSVFSTADHYFAIACVQDDIYYASSQSESTLFAPIRELSTKIFSTGSAILLCFVVMVYLYVVRFAKMELTKLEISQTALKKVASEINTDTLTKAGSRRYGTTELTGAFREFQENGSSPTILMFDIDSFKFINDNYGHDEGDQVLKEVVKAVSKIIRNRDNLIRWGGDEFVGIFYDVESEDVTLIANKILEAVGSLHIAVSGAVISPTVSLGISCFKDGDTGFSDAVRRADQAMYQSKAEGRNKVNIL